jgi:hypothetical protein
LYKKKKKKKKIELLESKFCKNEDDEKEFEAKYICETPNKVNKNIPGGT